MAVTLKRKRGAVSYKEPSSEEDFSESSSQEQTFRRRKRATPSRRSTRRQRPDSEDELSSQHVSPQSLPVRKQTRSGPRSSRSRGRQRISYKDISSDEEEEDPDADFELEEVQPPRGKSQTVTVRLSRPAKSSNSNGRPRRKLVLGAPLKPNSAIQSERKEAEIPTDGNQPAWASLPYHVLLQIFVYAAHPLHDENMKPMPSIPWLVHVARMCSTFTKPALTALYRNPPIFATRQTRKDLVHHLTIPRPDAHEDYRVMVKRLELDGTQMTALTDPAHSVADLAALVQSLTTLREIDIFDPIDRPPFRDRLRRLRRWVYPPELFEALRQTELRLRSWRWNRTFCDEGPLWMKTIHSDAAFQSLRELAFTKFHPEPSHEEREKREDLQGQPTTEELLASALAVLPHLRSLSFETCGVVSGRLLPLLPNNLISLNITNCGELLSDALQAFLASHGAQLEELVLNHNQSLSMSFLVNLKRACPKLEVLRMDTTYYSSLAMSSDNEPLYDTLLGESEMPSWPSSLRVIDMEYLRNWNSTSATNFFSSLIEAAEELPWLREITIMAMVDTDWRQRAEFRMKWSAKFKKVFARKWVAPSPHLASLRAFREWQAPPKDEEKNDSFIEGLSTQMPNGTEGARTADESDSDAPLIPSREQRGEDRWGSKRLRLRFKAATSYDEASGSEVESGDGEVTSDDTDDVFVQGRCHTVIFRIDNFRPREEIYDEADFLDAEPSGDEEWNGNEDNDDEGGYAW
ncbi:Nn.00g074980.m01.CDS01 [Neocucurbitaria sp. VM-36]